jgi:hypothetical protein
VSGKPYTLEHLRFCRKLVDNLLDEVEERHAAYLAVPKWRRLKRRRRQNRWLRAVGAMQAAEQDRIEVESVLRGGTFRP